MTIYTVQIPESLYAQLEEAAHRLQKPVSSLVTETLQAALPAKDDLPQSIRDELSTLDNFDAAALKETAESQIEIDDQHSLDQLLDLQETRPLTRNEEARLQELRDLYGRVLVKKARAYALLAEQGVHYSFD